MYPSLLDSLQTSSYCNTAPQSFCDVSPRGVGDEIGTGAFTFSPAKWNKLCQIVRLNDIGHSNGQIDVIFQDKLVLSVPKLTIHDGAGFVGIAFHSFFGGGNSTFASPQNQTAYFKDFEIKTFLM